MVLRGHVLTSIMTSRDDLEADVGVESIAHDMRSTILVPAAKLCPDEPTIWCDRLLFICRPPADSVIACD